MCIRIVWLGCTVVVGAFVLQFAGRVIGARVRIRCCCWPSIKRVTTNTHTQTRIQPVGVLYYACALRSITLRGYTRTWSATHGVWVWMSRDCIGGTGNGLLHFNVFEWICGIRRIRTKYECFRTVERLICAELVRCLKWVTILIYYL